MDAKTLALYLGCDFITDNSQGQVNVTTLPLIVKYMDRYKGFKLLLRPLSSMTEEEATQWLRMENNSDVFFKTDEWYSQLNDARKTLWLLSKGFDLFGLIEKGEAIDSTTETPTP